ncbi:hypothetical protein AnigIFM63604_006403 [Aspergillus niger]|uniref:Uncharacterized protein n=1 Tax=Aspergillus niger TaxID=5061 RepID=A0A9W6E9X2_ASPNG|nr:hypothetical protein AnigIFM63604_006403 [Aspergillus niger]
MASPSPFWGPSTSHANFCEEDYVVTRYIAEFINTLTNLVYIFYAIYGIRHLHRQSNKDVFRALPYWGLMGVGIASAAFHMNLKYHTQMMDDVSMLLTTTPVLHRVMTVNTSRRTSTILAILLSAALLGLVVVHVLTDELILHSVSFVVSVTIIGVRTMQLTTTRTPKNSLARRQIWGMVRFGAGGTSARELEPTYSSRSLITWCLGKMLRPLSTHLPGLHHGLLVLSLREKVQQWVSGRS